jgi:hypothetical protein
LIFLEEAAMIRASYFEDGYTRPGYIAPLPLMHAGLRFTYRPALVEERSQLNDAARQLASHLYDRHVAAFTSEKLVVWDLTDSENQPVPISPRALLRLHPEVFVRLSRIVLGWIASDVDPDWPQETSDQLGEEELAAAIAGSTVGEVREEHDVKN